MTDERAAARRILVLGANGPTGRLTVRQALDRGLEVVAVTRNPQAFPITHPHLDVLEGDATQPGVLDAAVAGCDAVLSVIGTKYTWQPVRVYSASAKRVVEVMRLADRRRLVVVTSMGTPKEVDAPNAVLRLLLLVWRNTFTRTLYDDMLRMERIVSTSGLDWTIVRPPGLSDAPAEGYDVAETRIDGSGMSRADLAAFLLDQLADRRWVGRIAAVVTPGLKLEVIRTIRQEVLKR